jgi:hypothetical protein
MMFSPVHNKQTNANKIAVRIWAGRAIGEEVSCVKCGTEILDLLVRPSCSLNFCS